MRAQTAMSKQTNKIIKLQESSMSKNSTESENYNLDKTKRQVNKVYSKNIKVKLNNSKQRVTYK